MARKETNEMSFLEHLEILRWHIIRALLSILVVAVVAFIFKDIVFNHILLAPKEPGFVTNRLLCELGQLVNIQKLCINSKPLDVISIKMAGQFSMHIMVSLIAGLVLAFPYVFHEFWRFIVPALYSKEKRHARGAVFYSSLLFMMGVTFGYFVIVPLSVHFLGSYQVSEQVNNQINLISYVSTLASVVLAAGVIFELPILVYFLTKAGLVTPKFLRKYRRHSLVLILALSAIITPPDIFSQVLVAFPLVILYEAGIRISRRIVTKREQEDLEREREEQESEVSSQKAAKESEVSSQKSAEGDESEVSGEQSTDGDESEVNGQKSADGDESEVNGQKSADGDESEVNGQKSADGDESEVKGQQSADGKESESDGENADDASGNDDDADTKKKAGKDDSSSDDDDSAGTRKKAGKDDSSSDDDDSAGTRKKSGKDDTSGKDDSADTSKNAGKDAGKDDSSSDDDDDDDFREYDEYGDEMD